MSVAAPVPEKAPDSKPTPPRWRWHHITGWLLLAGVVIWWRGPSYLRAVRPDFIPDGPYIFLPDFFQEWASARNRLEGLPVYTPQEVTAARCLGLHRTPADTGFIEYNA